MAKISRVFLLMVLLTIGFNFSALAQHQIDLTGNVPIYGQEECVYCGAACAQMIMNGYPNAADRIFVVQNTDVMGSIWQTIQANNSTNATDVDQRWATDPVGLRETLMLLNPPPGGTWNVVTDTDRDVVMFEIMYWMNQNHYPVATLINQGGHWVVIVGYESDIPPVRGSTPTLQQITIYDPEPHHIGSQSQMTGALWFADEWIDPVTYAGSWFNDYVAVIEPPVVKSKCRVDTVNRIGDELISPEEAVKYAYMWIKELGLSEKPAYSILVKEGVINYKPLLVREEIKPGLEEEKKVPYYYLVPFGFEHEKGVCGVGLTRVSIIVNAFTGQFEEVGTFGKPVRYLPKKEAIMIVTVALHLDDDDKKEVKASLLYQPSDITHIRLYPFWKVSVGDRILYVDQTGQLYRAIMPSIPGD